MRYFKDKKDGEYAFADYAPGEWYADMTEIAGPPAYQVTAQVKAFARTQLIADRNAAILGGFPYMGKQIDSDRDSVMAITGAAVAALAAKAANLPYSVIWTCADDSTIPLDADGVLGMAVALAMFADSQHAKARPLKESIAKETDPEKVKKVKW